MTKILFISWDGPQTSYMEGLFFPIFQAVQKQAAFEFHVLQFTWADKAKKEAIATVAKKMRIDYTAAPINRKPIASIGSFLTVFKGTKIIERYIKKHNIQILMPRSTFPAMMVNRLNIKGLKIVFDADGLPLEERVDFSGLSRKSFQYRFLKAEETKLLKNADCIIVRSQKAKEIHLKAIGESFRQKFFVVTNGRNATHFLRSEENRISLRRELQLEKGAKLCVFCGSLGPQYGWEEMLSIFGNFHKKHPTSQFLILTGNVAFAEKHLPDEMKCCCTIKSVPFKEVPAYLSAADIAFAIRKPMYSMQGVAPIKLGEYILMGLPTIASKGIGDTEEILKELKGNFLFNHKDPENIQNAVTFAENLKYSNEEIRNPGLRYFSLEISVESYISVLKKI